MRKLLQRLFIFATLLFSIIGNTQNFFYHLMPKQPVVNFTLASQTVNESVGVFAPDWPAAVSAWDKRRKIEITPVTTALTNFPLLIKLDSTKINYANFLAAGQDLRFVDSGGSLLSYEIETWDSSGESTIWVKIPTIAASPAVTNIWMYYGNAAAADAQTPTAVWDANHLGVWHFKTNGSDSTSNANNATVTGAANTASNIGKGFSFAGGSNNIKPPNTLMSNSTTVTLELWFKTSSTQVPLFAWAGGTYPGVPGGGYVPNLYIGSDGKLRGEQYVGAATPVTTASVVNDNQWHHVALAVGGASQSMYLDGALVGNLAGAISPYASTENFIGMGYLSGTWPSQASPGWISANSTVIDEVKISNNKRTADWILQEYNSVQDNVNIIYKEEVNSASLINATLQLSGAYPQNVTVPFTVTGTSTSGTDHNLASGSIVVTPGNLTQNIPIRIYSDNLTEGSETLIVSIGTPTNGRVGTDIPVHTVTITDDVNVAPVANNDTVNLTSFAAVQINVVSNDTDANGDTLWIQSNTSPSVGTIAKNGRTFTYTPSTDFPASDSFTYTVTDKRGGTSVGTVTLNYQIPFTWTGAGGDANWNTAANWLGGAVPGAGNTAYFNNGCGTNCNPQMNVAVSAAGLRMNSSYTGTITQGAGNTVTIGSSGWLQMAGTFTGSNANITLNASDFYLSGVGSVFTSTSAVFLASRNFSILNSAVFNHNNGNLTFDTQNVTMSNSIAIPNALNLYNLRLTGGQGGSVYPAIWDITAGSFNVTNDMQIGRNTGTGSAKFTGNIYLKGNITMDTANYLISSSGGCGTGNLTLDGTGAQTYSSNSGCVPNLIINKSSGTVTPTVAANNFLATSFTLTNGNFTAPTGTMTVAGGFTQSAGTTFTHNSGTVAFDNLGSGSIGGNNNLTFQNPLALNNLSFAGGFGGSSGTFNFTLVGGNSIDAAGNITIQRSNGTINTLLNGGTINVSGDINILTGAGGGTTIINSVGVNKTFTQAASTALPGSVFNVNKTATVNTLTQTAATALSTVGQDLTITQGTYNLAGFNLTVNDVLTIGSNGRLLCNGGTVTAGSSVITGEISCGAGLGITWTGNAGDNLWTTAGNWTNNTIPGASDLALFNGMCSGANCNVQINSNISVRGITMLSTYTGTLTQNSTRTLTVGTAGFIQQGGTFLGGDSAITLNGPFSLSAGTFTATSGTMSTNGSVNFTVTGSPTFSHNSGTITFTSAGTATNTVTPGTLTYNNVSFLGYNFTTSLVGTMTVNGNLTLGDTYSTGGALNTGTIDVKTNFFSNNYGKKGSALIKISGATNQSITGVSTAFIPNFQVISTGGTLSYFGNLLFNGNFTHSSGTIDAGTSTLIFYNNVSTTTITPSTVSYNNITFNGYAAAFSLVGNMTVNGTLTFGDTHNGQNYNYINTGTFLAYGDVVFNNYGYQGSALLKLVGSANQTLSGTTNTRIMAIEIASTGGTVSFSGTLFFTKNFTYTSGVVSAGTSTVVFYNSVSTTVLTTGSIVFNNVTFNGYAAAFTVVGSLTINGTLTLNDSHSNQQYNNINSGTLLAYGDVVISNIGYHGSSLLKIVGSGNQTISSVATATLMNLEFASTGGVVNLVGTFTLYSNLTNTSGTIDAGTSTLNFYNYVATSTVTPGTSNYNNITFGGVQANYTIVGTMNTNGTLTFADTNSSLSRTVNSGNLIANGNVVFSSYGKSGTANLSLEGAVSSNITTTAGSLLLNSSLVVAKTGGATVTMLSDSNYSTAGQDLTVTSGTLNLGGFDLTVIDTLIVGASGTVSCNGGDVFFGTLSNSGVMNCPGYSTYPFNWTGTAADGNWNTAGNWQGGVVPTSTDVVVFDDAYCGANCNVTLNTNVSAKGFDIKSGYTGTITQNAGVTIALGSKGWKQAGGTFTGGNSSITVTGIFSLTGGTFTSTSGTLFTKSTFTRSGTFNHNSGTLKLTAPYNTTRTITFGVMTVNNLEFNTDMNYDTYTMTTSGTITVLGNLALTKTAGGSSGTLNGGTYNVSGNISSTADFYGTMLTKAVGNSNQTISGTSVISNLEIASTGGTVTISGSPTIYKSFLYTSGTVSTTGSTVTFVAPTSSTFAMNLSAINFNNVTFLSEVNRDGVTFNLTSVLNVDGNLNFANTFVASSVSGSQINVKGNLSSTAGLFNGTAPINMYSTTSANISIAAGTNINKGSLTINKTGGATVTMTAPVSINTAGQNLTVTAGTLDMAGYALTVAGNISNSGTIYRGTNPSCGVLTMGGTLTGTASYCKSHNIALASNGSTATASSTNSANYLPSTINNGERNGSVWGTNGGWNDNTSNTFPDWVQVTFSMPTLISQIDVITVQDNYSSPSVPTLAMTFTLYGITSYQVQYWNGAAWTDVTGGNVTGNNKIWRQFTFTPVSTDRVRVLINGSIDQWSRIVEVEATSPP